MRGLALCVLLCACGGGRPAPPLLFDPPAQGQDRADIDLAAVDAGPFRFKLGGQTITAHVSRRLLKNGTLVHGTFGKRGRVVVARVGATVTGVIRDGSVGYELVPVAGGHRVVRRDWKKSQRSLHGPRWNEVAAARGKAPPPSPVSKAPVVIDVLFAYTNNVLRDRTLDGVHGLADAAIEDLNAASKEGGADVEFRVADVVPTSDTEFGDDGTRDDIYTLYYVLLHKLRFKDAHQAREAAHADILVLLVDSVQGGLGLGTIMGTPDTAVAVADHHDSLWYATIPHEIGHIMGGLHDDDTRVDPYPYGHGYSGKDGRTIMSNPCSSPDECPFVMRWSERPLGDDDWRNDARVIRETAAAVSTFGDHITP